MKYPSYNAKKNNSDSNFHLFELQKLNALLYSILTYVYFVYSKDQLLKNMK